MTKDKMRTIIVWVAAIIAFITGIALTITGFFFPPEGEISASVLTAMGELLAFFGSVFGISQYTKIQLAKIDKKMKGEDTED